jgi:hypothetical protein
MAARWFKVLAPNPQGLDHHGDGDGCESIGGSPVALPAPPKSAPQPAPANDCDASYLDVCIPLQRSQVALSPLHGSWWCRKRPFWRIG